MTTAQEIKTWLGRYRPIILELDSLIDERRKWAERAAKITGTISDMPKGGSGTDSLQQAVEVMAEIDEKIGAAYAEAYARRLQIAEAMDGVEDPLLRQLLKYRYIDFLRWEEIAEKMYCDRTTVWRRHDEAIRAIKAQKSQHPAT